MAEWQKSVVGERKVVLVGEVLVVVVVGGVALSALLLGGTGCDDSCMPGLALRRPSDYQRQGRRVRMGSAWAERIATGLVLAVFPLNKH